MAGVSPFLHRDERPVRYVHSASKRWRLDRDREAGRVTLERLRYRDAERHGRLSDFMQRIGNFGRRWFSWMDPHQTGGGWW